MNYIEKQYEEIFDAMLEDSLEKGLISHADEFQSYIDNHKDISNYYVMDKSVIAKVVAMVYVSMTSIYESHKVEYAEGKDLDDIGEILGITRPGATYAEAVCTFSINQAMDNNINIEEGVIVTTQNGIQYQTIEPIFIAAGSTGTDVIMKACTPGVSGKVLENTLTKIVTNLPYNLLVTNANSSSGGIEAYTDDEYRYLLMNWRKIYLRGSLEAYENYFANFDGIDSYKVIPNWNGTGTIKCILDPGTSYQLNKAYNELQANIVQATEDISMFAPTPKYIDIYAAVDVDIDRINPYSAVEKRDIQARIISAIKVFINGGYRNDGKYYEGLILGEDFIPHKLSVFLDEEIPELKNITFSYPEDYISILDEEIGVSNEITIEMI